jgi:anti-sigma regulatory factor (Ser/Thr protein kinase)
VNDLPAPITWSVPTDLAFVRSGRKMFEALLAAEGWGEEAVEDAALVYTEVLQNAIEHGSRNDGRETVGTICRVGPASAWVEVTDPGTGKDPREVLARDLTRTVPTDEARGRGLFLVNRLAARLDRALAPGGGCRIAVQLENEAS